MRPSQLLVRKVLFLGSVSRQRCLAFVRMLVALQHRIRIRNLHNAVWGKRLGAHGARRLNLKQRSKLRVNGWKVAFRAFAPASLGHVEPRGDAVRQNVFATTRALELGFLNGSVAIRARRFGLGFFGLVALANNSFNLLLVLLVDLVRVLWSHQHGRITKRRVFEARFVALDDGRGQDVDNVRRKFAYVVGHANQHACCLSVVPASHMELDDDVAVQNHKVLAHFHRDGYLLLLQLSVHAKEHVVSVAVVACGLLLTGNDDGGLCSIAVLLQGHVQLEKILGIFGCAVGLAEQIIDQLSGEAFVL
eukprot:m.20041 g.20041  ORF g.20041 m.20041 type:complete len:305 (+) comp6065_c0_seq2:157-1071(+)